MAEFSELGVLPEIIASVEELGWTLPTPVQAEAVPLVLGGGDVLAAAETGSGKTGAFALPVVQAVWEELRDIAHGKASFGANQQQQQQQKDSSQQLQLSAEDRDPGFMVEAGSGGLVASSSVSGWSGARATAGVAFGAAKDLHVAFEVAVLQLLNDTGIVRCGWAGPCARLDLGTDADGFGFGGTGRRAHRREFVPYGQPFGAGDVVTCGFDAKRRAFWFAKNGVDLGDAFVGVSEQALRAGVFPAVCIKGARVAVNFGSPSLRFPPARPDCVPLAQAGGVGLLVEGGIRSSDVPDGKGPLCVVLEPSRELAEQTHKAFETFSAKLTEPRISFALAIGGLPPGPQQAALRKGADVVTGTPGRLEAFVADGTLRLSNVRFLVLDEADSLAETCLPTIKMVWERVPKSRLQVLMFSATLHSSSIRSLADSICRFPTWVDLKGVDAIPTTVDHAYCIVDPRKAIQRGRVQVQTDGVHASGQMTEEDRLSENLKLQKAQVLIRVIEAHKMAQAIIFCRTKLDCDHLEAFLNANGGGKQSMLENEFSCAVVHGDRQQQERQANLGRFKAGEVRFLITTDVGARGIDVMEIPFVINYTLPDKPEDYIHRVGRVGRADRTGLAISIVGAVPERVWYHRCPSRGKNCQNRALLEKGGCTMWYDESGLWQAIRTRLDSVPLFELDSNFRDPRLSSAAAAQQYGQRRQEQSSVVSHAAELRGTVEELARLEDAMQLNFWAVHQELAAERAQSTASSTSPKRKQPASKKARK